MAPALSDRDRDASAKDGREMDFLDGELNAPELLQAAIKSFGEGPEADAMFPLAGALGGFLDEELQRAQQEELKERATALQSQLERRCDFLRRRLRLQQARAQGRRAAEEAAAGFERAARPRERGLTRQAVRALLERLRAAVSLSRRAPQPSPPIVGPPPPALASCAGALRAHLSLLRRHLDSDATESSSGAESDDEAVVYNNAHMRRMPLVKRAAWKWAQERASVASRWTWLQAQIQDIEYKIRQHAELQRRIRASKGVPESAEPSGYSGALPGQAVPPEEESCARLRPLDRTVFKRRKLLQMHNLHTAAEKAAKPSNIRCACQWPLGGCAVCTGKVLPMHPLPAASTLTKQERLALVDPGFHPVLSTIKEMSTSVQYSAKMKNNQWQQKSMRGNVKSLKGNPILNINKSPQASSKQLISQVSSISHSKKKKHSKSKRGRPTSVEMTRAVQAKRRASALDSGREMSAVGSPQGELVPYPSGSSSPVPSPSDHRNRQRERTERSRLNSSYDIDNIVIPHSIAATTKPEILQYKEILTPKWRIVEPDEMPIPNNGIIRKPSLPALDEKEEAEDISDITVVLRHERCEQLEKGKYLQKRKNTRRQQSRSGAGSSHPLTPSETPPHTPAPMVDETSMHSESANTSTVVLSPPVASHVINTVPSTSTYQPSFPSLLSQIDNNASSTTPNITTGNKRRLTLQMDDIEIIPPYSPRTFPLCDETYNKMLTMMPDNHPLSSGEIDQRNQSVVSGTNGSDSESNSGVVCCIQDNFCAERTVAVMEEPASDSDNDYLVPPEEDPNDPEWNASAHAE